MHVTLKIRAPLYATKSGQRDYSRLCTLLLLNNYLHAFNQTRLPNVGSVIQYDASKSNVALIYSHQKKPFDICQTIVQPVAFTTQPTSRRNTLDAGNITSGLL